MGRLVRWSSIWGALAVSAVTVPAVMTGLGAPTAAAKNGDTHIVGQGINQTLDCNDSTLLVNGSFNYITAVGTCWAVTVQGSSNIVVADTVINDVTVYGWDQTVYFHDGAPALIDRGRELGMLNRLERVPA